MAAPNLKTPLTITGKTAVYACTATLAQALQNPAASNKVFKINTLRAVNVTTNAAVIDISIYRGTTHTYIAKNMTVPPGSAVLVLDRDEYAYLEEGDAIWADANAISTVDLTIHYEEVS